jgi:hypothetical protein
MGSPMGEPASNLTVEDDSDLNRYSKKTISFGLLRNGSSQGTRSFFSWLDFPFATVSILIVLLSLFALSMFLGGWGWSSWTYLFSFAVVAPLATMELKRKAVITGGAALLLFFTVVIDAGLPQYFGYNPSDYSFYDNIAHLLGTFLMTWFLWAFICWTVSPTGPPKENGTRKFLFAIITMVLVSFIFEFLELITDFLFGWTNYHVGVDTTGDLIFDFVGIFSAALLIARHRISPIRRPFWHAEPSI